MKYLKTFETYDDALYDVLSNKNKGRNKEVSDLLDEYESPDSEEGKNISDKEREHIHRLLDEIAPDEVNRKGTSKETRDKNSLKMSKIDADSILTKVSKIVNDENYKPVDEKYYQLLKDKSRELKKLKSSNDYIKINNCIKELSKLLKDAEFKFTH